MKKTISVIFIVLALILIHTAVFADMGAPSIEPYIAIITNPDGVPYYSFEYDEETEKSFLKELGTFAYEDEVEIQYETSFNNELYGYFINEGSTFGYIKLENIEVKESKKASERNVDYKNPINFKVLKSDGLEIHKGPANVYEVIGKPLPFGSTITAYRFTEATDNPWYFITYKGVEGFICELDGALGKRSNFVRSIKTPNEVDIHSTATVVSESDEESNVIGTLPPNTVITSFYAVDDWSRMYYIENGKTSGYISYYDVTTEPVQLYKHTLKIPEGGLTLYAAASKDSTVLEESIPEDTSFTFVYFTEALDYDEEGWVNIKYEGKDGWILINPEYVTFNYDEVVEEEKEEVILKEENTVDDTVIPIEESSKVEVKSASMLPQIALMCAAIAVIIALTAFVTMKLVNKKKTNNDNNGDI